MRKDAPGYPMGESAAGQHKHSIRMFSEDDGIKKTEEGRAGTPLFESGKRTKER